MSQQLSFIGFFNLTDIAHLVNPLSPGSETTRTLQIELSYYLDLKPNYCKWFTRKCVTTGGENLLENLES